MHQLHRSLSATRTHLVARTVTAALCAALSLLTAAAEPQGVAPSVIPEARIDRWDPALDAMVPADARIEKLAEGFGWAEGPVWIQNGGYLLFTDVPGNKMWKWSAQGGLEKFLDPSGAANPDPAIWREAGANGLFNDGPNSILLADTGNRMIARLDLATKHKTPVATAFEGRKFSSPNDVVKTKTGVVFFTDPPYGFAKFDDAPQKEQPFNGVYRVSADGKVTVIEKDLTRPNGVALSPDERTLYVTQSEPARAIIMAYALDASGNVTGKRLFHDATDLAKPGVSGLPDGLTIAADGTLFSSAPGGILVLSKDGKRLGRISTGKGTANCEFGDDGRTLYLTSSNMLARVRLSITGLNFVAK
jgi:gluconolactonase